MIDLGFIAASPCAILKGDTNLLHSFLFLSALSRLLLMRPQPPWPVIARQLAYRANRSAKGASMGTYESARMVARYWLHLL